MHAKYEVSISYGSNVIAKVKVDNRQTTDIQTNKQTGQKQYAPIIRSGDINNMPRSFDPGHKNKIDRIEAMWSIRLNRQKIYEYRDFCFYLPFLHRISLFYPKIAMFLSFQLAIIAYALNKIMN